MCWQLSFEPNTSKPCTLGIHRCHLTWNLVLDYDFFLLCDNVKQKLFFKVKIVQGKGTHSHGYFCTTSGLKKIKKSCFCVLIEAEKSLATLYIIHVVHRYNRGVFLGALQQKLLDKCCWWFTILETLVCEQCKRYHVMLSNFFNFMQ